MDILQIPPQQPPYWYNRANQTHALWQSEADRQNREGGGYGSATQRPTGDYDGFVSQTQYTTHMGHGDSGPENVQRNQRQYHTSYSSSQQQQYMSEHGTPARQSSYVPIPVGPPHPVSSDTQHESSTWQSQRYEI